jgi:hypothetical protein
MTGDELRGWVVLSPGRQEEVMDRFLHLVTSCDHEWGSWEWEPGTAAYRGGFAKQCIRCRMWLYDIITNAGLADRA